MNKQFLIGFVCSTLLGGLAMPCFAQDANLNAQCLACHGPFESFIAKDVKTETDSGPVKPHVNIPHSSKKPEEFLPCVECHVPHTLPPPKNYKDTAASVEPCYACHHNYQFKKCSSCHN